MTVKIPFPLLCAVLASALTAAAMWAFDAPASTTGPPRETASIKTVYAHELAVNAQLDRIEKKLKVLGDVEYYTSTMYHRFGGRVVHNATPIELMYQTWCVVKDIPQDECGPYVPPGALGG